MPIFAIAALLLATRTDELEVFAAASLKDCFGQVAQEFQRRHPGVTVQFNFAGSQQLASQIDEGAPADVFASAAAKDLDKIDYDPSTRRDFASNRLVIVAPAGNPRIAGFRGLASVSRIVLAAPQVPAGAYSRKCFSLAAKEFGTKWLNDLNRHVVSQELDVRTVLAKVILGEAQAGVVYASDAHSAGRKVVVTSIDAKFQPKIRYPIAVVKGSHNPVLARAFVSLLMGAEGRKALTGQGFSLP